MAEECIHGLDVPLCDACYPKAKPDVVVAVKTRTPRVASGMPKRTSALAAHDDVSQQRIYHLTHVRNLPAIVGAGALVADATPEVDISSSAARETRRTIAVSDEGEAVASYVPFFLAPESDVWDAIRFGTADPRLDLEPGLVASDFVLLVSSVATVAGTNVVIADGDAAHPLTRFETTPDAADRALRKLRLGDETGRIRAAELLIRDSVDLQLITLVTVANDRAKAEVRDILAAAGNRTRIAIHPPWFSREPEQD